MECPHLSDNCKISRDIIKSKRCQLIDGCGASVSPSPGSVSTNSDVTSVASSSSGGSSGVASSAVGAGNVAKVWKCSGELAQKKLGLRLKWYRIF